MDVSALLKDGGATAWAAAGLGVLACLCGIALLAGTLFGARSSILRGMAFITVALALIAKDWDKCFTTPWSLGAATPAHALPAHAENQKRCAEHFTTPDDLRRLLSAAWVDDPILRDAVNKRINEPPSVAAPTPPAQPAPP